MSGIMSLESSIRTCKVDPANSTRIQSDRFLNPRNAVCPVWDGLDAAGRLACPDSWYTKREGCNSSADRIGVENVLRPQYMQYISSTLGTSYNNNSPYPEGQMMGYPKEGFEIIDFETPSKDYSKLTGSVGDDLKSKVWNRTCGYYRYDNYQNEMMGNK